MNDGQWMTRRDSFLLVGQYLHDLGGEGAEVLIASVDICRLIRDGFKGYCLRPRWALTMEESLGPFKLRISRISMEAQHIVYPPQ